MPTYTFEFDLDLWIEGVEIQACSKEEAFKKLRSMSAEDLIEKGYIKNFGIENEQWYEEGE